MSDAENPLHKGLPVLACSDAGVWDRWLTEHHTASAGVWLKLAKKDAAVISVGKPAAIETALRHGWVDGQIDRWDEHAWLVRFTPRGPRSRWSAINRDTATRLISEGRMRAAGLREVERAEADGRWAAAYPSQSKADVPADFAEALAAEPSANAFFASLGAANRYAFLYRIHHTKTPEARAVRIADFVRMLSRGEAFH